MKRRAIQILLGLALGVAVVYCTSCRSIQRHRSTADSSSVRTEATAERWAREVVTEYIPLSGSMSLPTITVPDFPELRFLPGATVQVPVPGPERIIKQIIRESGEKQATVAEEKKTTVTEKATERQWSVIQERSLLLVSVAFLLLALAVLVRVVVGVFRPR